MNINKYKLSSTALIIALCFSLPINAYADKKKKTAQKSAEQAKPMETEKHKWKEEPTSFLGIKFDEPLNNSVSSECPNKDYGGFRGLLFDQIEKLPEGTLCYFVDAGFIRVWNIKVPEFNRDAIITTDNDLVSGKVGNIVMEFKSVNFDDVSKIMRAKYGEPHKSSTDSVKTNGGAEFPNLISEWSGNAVSIRVESLARREADKYGINSYGRIYVTSNKFIDTKIKSEQKSIQDSAGKL